MFQTIDKILRGEYTQREDLLTGKVTVSVRTLVLAGLLLGAIYGAFMGLYSVLKPSTVSVPQLLATTAKVPLLFLLTLVVTFPSLYVFSALVGSRLRFVETLRLLLVGIVVNLTLLASFGPVTGFFTLSTESYNFMILLNVIFFAAGGLAGLVIMYKALKAVVEPPPPDDGPKWEEVSLAEEEQQPSDGPSAPSGAPRPPLPPPAKRPPAPSPFGVRRHTGSRARLVFCVWAVIYGAVGAQMGWILRPFVGHPDLPFELFRERQSNFFEALFATLARLLGAG